MGSFQIFLKGNKPLLLDMDYFPIEKRMMNSKKGEGEVIA